MSLPNTKHKTTVTTHGTSDRAEPQANDSRQTRKLRMVQAPWVVISYFVIFVCSVAVKISRLECSSVEECLASMHKINSITCITKA